MSKQQTAVEWLANVWAVQGKLYTEDIEQAKEMEKEQIMNAYNAGESDGDHYEDSSLIYYIDTFKIK